MERVEKEACAVRRANRAPSLTTPHHALAVDEALKRLEVDAEEGLSSDEVERRRRKAGPNRLREAKRRSVLRILAAQFRSVVVAILSAAGVLAFAFGKHTEGVAILAVILVNTLIGFVSEWRAARSMEALRKMGGRRVRVRRDGSDREVDAEDLVPGDVCLHEGGDMVSADLRLVEANRLQVDESALTGESEAVRKQTGAVEEDAALADRSNMLYRGTTITEGSAAGAVVATGMDTEIGHIAEMAEEAGEAAEASPLERRLNQLGHRLAWVSLGAAAVIAAAGLIAGRPTLQMIETAIALGVAAIPEGLPFVATIGLARGMWLLARRQALINRLPAVETLGATDVIMTDKTGTLTENRMVAAALATQEGDIDLRDGPAGEPSALARRALEIGALCNNASMRDEDRDGVPEETGGDPTEVALLLAAAAQGIERNRSLEQKPEEREWAFDPDLMMMATIHRSADGFEVNVKGAPSSVLDRCTRVAGAEDGEMDEAARERWAEKERALAGRGLRVLALADRRVDSADAEPYQDLRLVGLIGLLDPPRADVKAALAKCRKAGIRVVLVTGDQPETARSIAEALDLGDEDGIAVLTGRELGDVNKASGELKERIRRTPVFARVSPEQKLRLLSLLQDAGHIVAMTGDGVNDAPALSRADIGLAMGRRGTDAAKESADMLLKDDAFSTIPAAVEQGRVIFTNIRKSALFMLCTNVAEVVAVGVASLAGWPLPLRPLQILFLNVITDVFPALALSVGKGDPERAMQRPPRDRNEALLGRPQWAAIAAWSSILAVCVLGALVFAVEVLGVPTRQAVTVSFLTLGFGKLWFVLNLRERAAGVLRNDITLNPWIWAALGLCVLLLVAAVYLPGLSTVLETAAPGGSGWLVILALSIAPVVIGQVWLAVRD